LQSSSSACPCARSPASSAAVIELRPLTPAFLEAVLAERRDDAAAILGVELPSEFPRDGERRFLALRLRQMREDARFEDWSPFAVVLEGRMIGHAGYHGPPGVNTKQNPDAVEIGYTIEPEYRRRGYATAAASELIRRAEERGIRHVIACSSPGNEPSLAIIRGLGFTQTGEAMDEEDGLELVFERERSPG
jgi:ribosomal-protein-alanine N-acetyltransferase